MKLLRSSEQKKTIRSLLAFLTIRATVVGTQQHIVGLIESRSDLSKFGHAILMGTSYPNRIRGIDWNNDEGSMSESYHRRCFLTDDNRLKRKNRLALLIGVRSESTE